MIQYKAKAVVSSVVASFISVLSFASVASAANSMPSSFHAWNEGAFYRGNSSGVTIVPGAHGLELSLPAGASIGTWTSNSFTTPAPVNKIVTSWQATTPGQSRLDTRLQVELTNGTWSGWYEMGHWALASFVDASGNFTSQRGSVSNQVDGTGSISQDTYYSPDQTWVKAYRVQEVLHGNATGPQPTVRQVAATAADIGQNTDNTSVSPVSTTTMARTVNLPVPQLAQYPHTGEYTQLDGGGPAWCSPTSVSMVLGYYGKWPTKQQIASLPPDATLKAHGQADAAVDYAAFHIFDNTDSAKDTGDWPFNMAYAASFDMDASVRQYNSLQDIESWIKQGVPVVITISWDNTSSDSTQHLDGTSIPSTPGHLLVVRGFTKSGDVIVNDPASPNDAAVPHTYNRAQFEHRWLATSDGTVYIIKPLQSHN